MHQPATDTLDRALDFSRAVPRHLVHRAAIAEVFVTDAVRLGEHNFLVAAQWPRDHAVYTPNSADLTDSVLFMETIRQSLVYLAHTYFDVPLTHRFIGSAAEFEITDPGPLHVGATPVPAVLEAQWLWVGNRPPHRYGVRLEVVLTVGGRTCGRGALQLVAVDDKRYSLLRRRKARPAAPAGPAPEPHTVRVHPSAVGRLRVKDSILARTPEGPWQLLIDLRHAVHFDHPSDHLPLMVAVEGFRQLGHLLANSADRRPGRARSLVGLEVDCLAFGELDEPIHLLVREQRAGSTPDRCHLVIDAVQNGTVLATSRAVWAYTEQPAVDLGQQLSA